MRFGGSRAGARCFYYHSQHQLQVIGGNDQESGTHGPANRPYPQSSYPQDAPRERQHRIVRSTAQSAPAGEDAAHLADHLSDPSLHEQIARATNKAESYNGFTKWLAFGNHGTLTSRDPERQERSIKFLDLVASSVIFSTAVDMTTELPKMAAEGRKIIPADLAVLSPHRRENIRRFGEYTTDGLQVPPRPFDPRLNLGGSESWR